STSSGSAVPAPKGSRSVQVRAGRAEKSGRSRHRDLLRRGRGAMFAPARTPLGHTGPTFLGGHDAVAVGVHPGEALGRAGLHLGDGDVAGLGPVAAHAAAEPVAAATMLAAR